MLVRLPARKRAAGFSVPGQRPDRRLSADGGDADDAKSFRRLSRRISTSSKPFSTATVTPATNSARRRRWPAWKFCKAKNPFARGRSWKQILRDELQIALAAAQRRRHPAGRAWLPASNWSRTGGRASRLTCANARASAFARRWPRRGVLTRPVGNVIVLMPPYCTTPAQLQKMVSALREAVEEFF